MSVHSVYTYSTHFVSCFQLTLHLQLLVSGYRDIPMDEVDDSDTERAYYGTSSCGTQDAVCQSSGTTEIRRSVAHLRMWGYICTGMTIFQWLDFDFLYSICIWLSKSAWWKCASVILQVPWLIQSFAELMANVFWPPVTVSHPSRSQDLYPTGRLFSTMSVQAVALEAILSTTMYTALLSLVKTQVSIT